MPCRKTEKFAAQKALLEEKCQRLTQQLSEARVSEERLRCVSSSSHISHVLELLEI